MKSEKDLAERIVAYLEGEAWDVYQEVVPLGKRITDRRADIVATRSGLLWVVECKRSLNLEVLNQAYQWKRYAHLVSVAYYAPKRSGNDAFAQAAMRSFGIGTIVLGSNERATQIEASLNRKAMVDIWRLDPEHKTHAKAGSCTGGHWSEFRRTKERLEDFVRNNPGCTMKAAIDSIRHHYASNASARCALVELAGKGVLGIRVDQTGKAFRLWPV